MTVYMNFRKKLRIRLSTIFTILSLMAMKKKRVEQQRVDAAYAFLQLCSWICNAILTPFSRRL